MWSLAAHRLISLDDVPSDLPLREELEAAEVRDYCRGGSAIAAADSRPDMLRVEVDRQRLSSLHHD